MRTAGLAFKFALAVFAAAVTLCAQPPAGGPASGQQPTFRVEANFVRVDIYATENGVAVTDLTADDFQVAEDGVPQKIETFQHVQVRAAGPEGTRIEPNTQRESDAAAADPRSRIFVLFLDTYHVDAGGSHNVRQPLVDMLDRVIGQNDLVGVMTPEMSAANLVLARKTETIEGILTKYWHWGRRDRDTDQDPEEDAYEQCYPGIGPTLECSDDDRGVAREMILRRSEKRSLDALQDLVVHLRGLREERKAVITISEGWTLFRPNDALARRLYCQVPGTPEVFVDPVGGKLSSRDRSSPRTATRYECDRDRMRLSQLDDERQFRALLDDANRANASFYPIDPRGLPVFDTPMGSAPPLPASRDQAQLRGRLDTLRTLALATDGVTIIGSNDLERGLRRMAEDLTSYYLVGYYSSNTKLDGRFRAIKVTVRRPGVDVRARRGYRAATADEAQTKRIAPNLPGPGSELVPAALATLATIKRDARLRLRTAVMPPGGFPDPLPLVWIVGEIDAAAMGTGGWKMGATASINVSTAGGSNVTQAHAAIAPGSRSFVAEIRHPDLAPGTYVARVQATPGEGVPALEVVRFTIPEKPAALGEPLWFRRGSYASLAFEPAADFRFRRSERLRIEIPAIRQEARLTARLLDRMANPMKVPVIVTERQDPGRAVKWLVGELSLAPLAAGDYIVEMAAEGDGWQQKVLAAFQLVP